MYVAYKSITKDIAVQGMDQQSQTNTVAIERMKNSSVLYHWVNKSLSANEQQRLNNRIYHQFLTQRLANNEQLIERLMHASDQDYAALGINKQVSNENVTDIQEYKKNQQADGLYRLMRQLKLLYPSQLD
jgi:hypothetical protein